MRWYQFLSFSNEETLAQGVHDFLKASKQTSGGAGTWTLSPQAQQACSLWPLCSPPSWREIHASQNNTYLIPWDAFGYVPFLCYPQLLVTMPHIDVLTLIGLKLPFGKSCDVLLPNQLLTPPFIPPHRHSDTSGSLSCLFFFFFLSSSLLSWTAPMTLFPSIHSLYWHQSTLESTFLFLYLFVFIYLLIFLFVFSRTALE